MYSREPNDALCRVNFTRDDLLILIADLLTMMAKHGRGKNCNYSLVNIIRPQEKQCGMLGNKPIKTYEAVGLLDIQCRKSNGDVISAAEEIALKDSISELFKNAVVVEVGDFDENN